MKVTCWQLRGKTGESKISRPIQLAFKHRDFRQLHHVTLKNRCDRTNRSGTIDGYRRPFGRQSGKHSAFLESSIRCAHLRANRARQSWRIDCGCVPSSRGSPTAAAAADIVATRSELSLLEVRNDVYVRRSIFTSQRERWSRRHQQTSRG